MGKCPQDNGTKAQNPHVLTDTSWEPFNSDITFTGTYTGNTPVYTCVLAHKRGPLRIYVDIHNIYSHMYISSL